jgi:hypothetical protein
LRKALLVAVLFNFIFVIGHFSTESTFDEVTKEFQQTPHLGPWTAQAFPAQLLKAYDI